MSVWMRHASGPVLVWVRVRVPPLGFQGHPAMVGTAGEAAPADCPLELLWLQEEPLGYFQNVVYLHGHTRGGSVCEPA